MRPRPRRYPLPGTRRLEREAAAVVDEEDDDARAALDPLPASLAPVRSARRAAAAAAAASRLLSRDSGADCRIESASSSRNSLFACRWRRDCLRPTLADVVVVVAVVAPTGNS